jgi:lipid-binding SYLF domain-containing protein
MMNQARAMMIVPSLIKGGFIFGAEGGNGVLLARTGRGWSAPAFYSLGSASFGLQIGLEKAQIVMLIMSDRALKAIQDGDVKLGAGGGLTVVTLSAGAEGATASNLSGDIVIWTSATGAYGGLTLNGSVIQARREWNEAYYGRPIPVGEILAGQVRNPPPDGLRQKLSALR